MDRRRDGGEDGWGEGEGDGEGRARGGICITDMSSNR